MVISMLVVFYFFKFISRVQVHDLQDILEVDRNKLEVGMGSVGTALFFLFSDGNRHKSP